MGTKKIRRVLEDKFVEDWEKELNIKHNKLNPESDYTFCQGFQGKRKRVKSNLYFADGP